jgi:DNA polymerase elongation subunit (family B)
MDDVDPIVGFLSTNQFMFTGWYSSPGLEIDVKELKYIPGVTDVTYPKVACIDIETYCSSGHGMPRPYMRKDTIEMVSIVFKRYMQDDWNKYLIYVGNEKLNCNGIDHVIPCSDELELIKIMAKVISDESPDVITGYNIFGFDLGYIISRLKLRLMPLPDMSRGKHGTTTTRKVNWSSSAYGQNTYDRVEVSGRVFVDLMLFFRRMKLDRYSLDYISSKFLGGKGKMDMPYDLMWEHFRTRDITGLERIAEYCVYDSVLTMELFDKFYIWTDMCEMSSAMKCSIEDIYTRGEQLKVLNQVIYKCVERKLVLVPRQKPTDVQGKYQGAYVLEPKKGIYEGCTVVDFQSLYPSILIAYNICPSTYMTAKYYKKESTNVVDTGTTKHVFRKEPIGILPDLVRNLLDQRFAVKKLLKDEVSDDLTRMVLDRRQNALKICANSVYGITGFVGNKYMGHVGTAESITCKGRQLLESVVKKVQKDFPVQVVYGDTDSCMIYHDGCLDKTKNMEMAEKIVMAVNKDLPKPLTLLVEKYYNKMAFLTKKRYLMYDGKEVSSKGVASTRRNYCNFTRKLYSDTVGLIFTTDRPDYVLDFVIKAMDKLMRGKVPLEDLVMTKSVKPLESYTSANVPHVYMARRLLEDGLDLDAGTRLEYLFVKTPGAKLQGERMFTPDEVQSLGLEIDYKYYIEKQMAIALDEILGLIGFEGIVKYIARME